MRRPTIIRAAGLAVEAEGVIAITKAPILTGPGTEFTDAFLAPVLRFDLETGNSILWRAETEDEADRVMNEVIAAKLGEAPLPLWTVIVEFRHFEESPPSPGLKTTGKWEVDIIKHDVEAESRESAIELVKQSLPGNTQTTRYTVTGAVRGES